MSTIDGYTEALERKISDHRHMLFIVFGGIATAEPFTGQDRLLSLLESHLGIPGMSATLKHAGQTMNRGDAIKRVLTMLDGKELD